MFETEVFESKCTVLKKVLVTLLGLFGARGIAPPLPPLVAPLVCFYCSLKQTVQFAIAQT